MKREFLQELKLDDEVINKIMAEHGKTVNGIKQKLDEKTEELKVTSEKTQSYETQIEEQKKLLGESEKFKEESEQFKSKYSDLETKFNSEVESKNKEIANVLKRSLVKEKLITEGAKHTNLLMKEINFDKITVKDDKLFDFDDTFGEIKTNYADLFIVKENQQNANTGNGNQNNNQNDTSSDWDFMDEIKK